MIMTSSLLGHLRALSSSKRSIVRELAVEDGGVVTCIGEPITELTFLLSGSLRRHVGEYEVQTMHANRHAELVAGAEVLVDMNSAVHRQTLSAIGSALIARVTVREIGQAALKELLLSSIIRTDALKEAASSRMLDTARVLEAQLGFNLVDTSADERSAFFLWLAANAVEAVFPDGEALCIAGEPADALYFVTGGLVGTYNEATPPRLVSTRGSGTAIGESFLLAQNEMHKILYTTTVIAKGVCTTLRFNAKMREEVHVRFPGVVRCVRQRLMHRLIRQWMALRDMPDGDAICAALSSVVEYKRYAYGATIDDIGRYGSHALFLIAGECGLAAKPAFYARYSAGAFFGLASMIPPGKRTLLSVKMSALTDCQLLVADIAAVDALGQRFPGLLRHLKSTPTQLSTVEARCEFLARYLPSYVLEHLDRADAAVVDATIGAAATGNDEAVVEIGRTSTLPMPANQLGPHVRALDALAVMIDVSGFTRLTAELSLTHGASGSELLSDALTEYFGHIVDTIEEHGGDISKFAGDALLVIWPFDPSGAAGAESRARAAYAALSCCQQLMASFDKYEIPGGHVMRLHAGVGIGKLRAFIVGGNASLYLDVLAGDAIADMNLAMEATSAGHIFATPTVAHTVRADPRVTLSAAHATAQHAGGCFELVGLVRVRRTAISTRATLSAQEAASTLSAVPRRAASGGGGGSWLQSVAALATTITGGGRQRQGSWHGGGSFWPTAARADCNEQGVAAAASSADGAQDNRRLAARFAESFGPQPRRPSPASPAPSAHSASTSAEPALLEYNRERDAMIERQSQVADGAKRMASFTSQIVRRRLDAGMHSDWMAEAQTLSVVFIKMPSCFDFMAADESAALAALQGLVCCVQRVIAFFGGCVLRLICDDKGTHFLSAFGLVKQGDDACKAVEAALALQQQLRVLELPAEVLLPRATVASSAASSEATSGGVHQRSDPATLCASIGITTGDVYCGPVGGKRRCEFTCNGPTVNLAARLMVAASKQPEGHIGILLDRETRALAEQRVSFLEDTCPLVLKGIEGTFHAHTPVRQRARTDAPATSPADALAGGAGDAAQPLLFGREDELAAVREWHELSALAGDCLMAPTLLICGEAGMGKTALLAACAAYDSNGAGAATIRLSGHPSYRATPHFVASDLAEQLLQLPELRGLYADILALAQPRSEAKATRTRPKSADASELPKHTLRKSCVEDSESKIDAGSTGVARLGGGGPVHVADGCDSAPLALQPPQSSRGTRARSLTEAAVAEADESFLAAPLMRTSFASASPVIELSEGQSGEYELLTPGSTPAQDVSPPPSSTAHGGLRARKQRWSPLASYVPATSAPPATLRPCRASLDMQLEDEVATLQAGQGAPPAEAVATRRTPQPQPHAQLALSSNRLAFATGGCPDLPLARLRSSLLLASPSLCEHISLLAELLPVRTKHPPRTAALGEAEQQGALHALFAAMLSTVGARRGVTLLVDDAHLVDAQSLALISQLGGVRSRGCAGLRVAYAFGPLSAGHAHTAALSALRKQPGVRHVQLRPLPADAAVRLLTAAVGQRLRAASDGPRVPPRLAAAGAAAAASELAPRHRGIGGGELSSAQSSCHVASASGASALDGGLGGGAGLIAAAVREAEGLAAGNPCLLMQLAAEIAHAHLGAVTRRSGVQADASTAGDGEHPDTSALPAAQALDGAAATAAAAGGGGDGEAEAAARDAGAHTSLLNNLDFASIGRSMTAARIDRLPPRVRMLLKVLAVLDGPFPLEVARALSPATAAQPATPQPAGQQPQEQRTAMQGGAQDAEAAGEGGESELCADLAKLVQHGYLTLLCPEPAAARVADGAAQQQQPQPQLETESRSYCFGSKAMKQTCLAMLTRQQSRTIHSCAADYFATSYRAGGLGSYAQIGSHYAQAAMPEPAAHYLLLAAEQAFESAQAVQAKTHLEGALVQLRSAAALQQPLACSLSRGSRGSLRRPSADCAAEPPAVASRGARILAALSAGGQLGSGRAARAAEPAHREASAQDVIGGARESVGSSSYDLAHMLAKCTFLLGKACVALGEHEQGLGWLNASLVHARQPKLDELAPAHPSRWAEHAWAAARELRLLVSSRDEQLALVRAAAPCVRPTRPRVHLLALLCRTPSPCARSVRSALRAPS